MMNRMAGGRADHGMSPEQIQDYQRRYGKGPHVTVDLAIISMRWEPEPVTPVVLLIERGNAPFQGQLALPGGFVDPEEDLEQAALRELTEETGLEFVDPVGVQQLGAFGQPGRDPRARTVSIVHLALVPWEKLHGVKAGDDAAQAGFYAFHHGQAYDAHDQPLRLAFDHDQVLASVWSRIQQWARYSSAPLKLLPSRFSAIQLAQVYGLLTDQNPEPAGLEQWLLRQGWIAPVANQEGQTQYRVRCEALDWSVCW